MKKKIINHPSAALLLVIIAITLLSFSCKGSRQTDFYVSVEGDDSNPGTLQEPFASITKAKEVARDISTPVNIIVRGGTYYLSDPLTFTPEDSRTEKAPLTVKSFAEEEVILSGAVALELDWSSYKDGIWQSQIDKERCKSNSGQ